MGSFNTSRFCKLVIVLGILGVILVVVGVVLLVIGTRSKCDETSNKPGATQSNACSHSQEALRINLGDFLDKVKKTYFKLHPFKVQNDPDLTVATDAAARVKAMYTAYNPTPSAIKTRTDSAWSLLKELDSLNIVKQKLKARESKAVQQVQLYLKQVFGNPYEVNYYTGDWMMGPDSFCYSMICYMGYEFYNAMLYHRPSSLRGVELIRAKLMTHKVAIQRYIDNTRMGVEKGMVRNVESCRAGLDALKQEHRKISLFNETGVLQEWYAAVVVSPSYYKNITPAMNDEWRRTHSNVNVSESVKQYLVEYLGRPIAGLFRYLKDDHLRHCVPSSVSSGLATLPLKYIYTDGIANTSRPTDPTLPLTDRVLDGKKAYEMIMPYYTTNNMTANEVYDLGIDMLGKLYPKAVQIAREVTKVYNDNDTAIREFRKILNSSASYFNPEPFPQNESDENAHRRCSDIDGARKHCPDRWQAMQDWFKEAREVMSMLDPKTVDMFYFTGSKHTTPNCPVDLNADFNPSSGAQSYWSSNKACTRNAGYYIPFFLERLGPRFLEWSINAHEARPGHHLQVQGDIEHFQDSCSDSIAWLNSNSYYTAFSEGWALYAENPLIAEDTNIYDNEPMQRYGMLNMQIWRAIRLVVDTGLHYKGMTRSQALQIHSEKAWDDTDVAHKEVTRYQSVPGQALGYMIGQLDIKKARQFATDQLGAKFDLKEFHFQLLSQGTSPLGYLAGHIQRYVSCKKHPMKTGCTEILVPLTKITLSMGNNARENDYPIVRPTKRHYI